MRIALVRRLIAELAGGGLPIVAPAHGLAPAVACLHDLGARRASANTVVTKQV